MRLRKSDINSIAALKASLDASPAIYQSVETLASLYGMSEARFQFAFKKICGCTVHAYFLHRRMQQAKELLQDDRKKLYAIARACGYKHLSTFITAFKKYTGYTPGTYRNLLDQ